MVGSPLKITLRLARRFGWPRLIGTLLLLLLLALRLWDPAPVQLLRFKVFDFYQVAKPRTVEKRPVVIVDIDEASLEKLGQWPWPRTLLADLVNKITGKGGVAIAFDILFPEPDRTSPHLIADALPELSDAAREEIRKARNHDEVFADALLSSRVVLAQSAYNPRIGKGRTGTAPPAAFGAIGPDPKPFLFKYPALLSNIQELETAAKGRGMVTVQPDPDGVVRKVPMLVLAQDRVMPSLTTELLRVATGQKAFLIRSTPEGIKDVVVAGVPIPTDRNGLYWVHFSPHDEKRFVSALDVIEDKVPVASLAGKLVLVGTSASGLFDLKATPVDPALPGVEIHAQVLESVLAKDSLSRPSFALGAEIAGAILIGAIFMILVPIIGALASFLSGALIAALTVGVSWYMFAQYGLLIDVTYPLTSAFIIFLALVFSNYFREEAERRQVRGAFGQYLSPALVEQLAQNPDRLTLGGETREMSFLFSDVRGFTAISESFKSDPQGLTRLMNRFLTPLSNAILEREGTIDKYMGDAIMAFWNAPIDVEDHAVSACDAALDMLARLDAVNDERRREAEESDQPFLPLDVGVGINTGECVVGNMGSDTRFDYSVLGDSVNLASRLEGQSKAYGVKIIIGSRTAEAADEVFALLELDRIRVKGKSEPEVIYTILGRKAALANGDFETVRQSMARMLEAYRGQDWAEALDALSACRAAGSGLGVDGLCDLYGTRIAAFREAPPPAGWDGVFTAETK